MKKFFISCAVVLAAGMFASCGDTNYCYEITYKVTVLGIETTTTTYSWCTSNEIKAVEKDIKDGLIATGISEDAIKISSKRTGKSQADCK